MTSTGSGTPVEPQRPRLTDPGTLRRTLASEDANLVTNREHLNR